MKFIELSDKEIITIVKPLAEHTESSWNQKSYDDFCRYLLENNPYHKFPEEEFDTTNRKVTTRTVVTQSLNSWRYTEIQKT